MKTWDLFFGWPNGQVWPNLIAAAITFGLSALVAVKKLMPRVTRWLDDRLVDHRDEIKRHITESKRGEEPS